MRGRVLRENGGIPVKYRNNGKCHRKQTAASRRGKGEKVRQELTAPFGNERGHGKPLPEQDQIRE
jgi:hypothetical protein